MTTEMKNNYTLEKNLSKEERRTLVNIETKQFVQEKLNVTNMTKYFAIQNAVDLMMKISILETEKCNARREYFQEQKTLPNDLNFERGRIFYATLPEREGALISKPRPVVILQTNLRNSDWRTRTLTVIPLTSSRPNPLSSHVVLSDDIITEDSTKLNGSFVCEQITIISIGALTTYEGKLNELGLAFVERAALRHMGIYHLLDSQNHHIELLNDSIKDKQHTIEFNPRNKQNVIQFVPSNSTEEDSYLHVIEVNTHDEESTIVEDSQVLKKERYKRPEPSPEEAKKIQKRLKKLKAKQQNKQNKAS